MDLGLALLFITTSQALKLPTGLLSAVCFTESSHVEAAVNPNDGGGDSLGICQIKYKTAKQMGFKGTVEQLKSDRVVNIHYAGRYLHYQLRRYRDDYVRAVAAYNTGTLKIDDETDKPINQVYIKKVFVAWAEGK